MAGWEPRQTLTRQLAVFGLFLSMGCGCPEFDEMEVGDPDGALSPWDKVTVQAGIADFERWSGLDGVCVPEVSVVAEINGGLASGRYYGPHQAIEVISGAGPTTTVHELCHAWDFEHGGASEENLRLFPVDRIDPFRYRTRSSQVRESFARICERGPYGQDVILALEEECGVELRHPAMDFVLDEVFVKAERTREPARLTPFTPMTRSIGSYIGQGTLRGAASGQDFVVLLVEDPADPPGDSGIASESLGLTKWRLVSVDPFDGMPMAEETILVDQRQDVPSFRLLDSSDRPVLLLRDRPGVTYAWRLGPDLSRERLSDWSVDIGLLPGIFEGGGVVLEDVALLPVGEDQVATVGAPWVAVDLASGEMTEHPSLMGLREAGEISDRYVAAWPEGGWVRRWGSPVEPDLPLVEAAAYLPAVEARLDRWTPEQGWRSLTTTSYGVTPPLAVGVDGKILAMFSHYDDWGSYVYLNVLVLHRGGSDWGTLPEPCEVSSIYPTFVRAFYLDDGNGPQWWMLAWVAGSSQGGRYELWNLSDL
jgi:hypothetical protein